MKKKGFTLIELLAVILILAILAVITIPIISNMLNSSKKKAFESKMYAVIEAAETYYEDVALEMGDELFSEGLDGTYSLSLDLANKDDLKKLNISKNFDKGLLTITEDGEITVTAIKDNLCGEKPYKSSVINMLSIDNDLSCFLLDSSSSNMGSNEILSAIQGLRAEVENLSGVGDRLATLENENKDLKETVKALNEGSATLKAYPVGSIYISTDLDTVEKVHNALGGTWEVYGNGKVLRSSTGESGQTNNSTGDISLTAANLPAHTHSFTPSGTVSQPTFTGTAGTTGNQNALHTHGGTTGTESANHTHTFSATTSTNGSHSHYNYINGDINFPITVDPGWLGGTPGWLIRPTNTSTNYYNLGTNSAGNHAHTVSGTTSGISNTHTHSFTTGTESAYHTHGFTPAGTVSQPTFTGTAGTTGSTGTSTAFSVLDPYITVHMFRRVS